MNRAVFVGCSLIGASLLAACSGEVTGQEAEPEVEVIVEQPKHWSFKPLAQTAPPTTEDEWVRNPIDGFVLQALTDAGLEPAPEVSPEKLLRRVTLSLTGLPPTVEEIDAFLADPSDEAYAAVVDHLLASPRYAEHMTAAWLDLARYSDTDGFQYDTNRPAWPWRDWVLQAFDTNLPYDQFTIQQIAGDMMPGATEDSILATAFNRNHAIQGENGLLFNEFRDRYVTDRVDTMGKGWLGLTLGCAKCHDHKFDPITAKDFFSLYDCFNQLDEYDNGPNSDPPYSPTAELQSPYAEEVTAAMAARLTELQEQGAPETQINSLMREQGRLEVAPIRVMIERAAHRDTYQLALGRYDAPVGDPLYCSAPDSLPPFPEGAPQNRYGLAMWLVMPENPLTSRVTVNRYWQHHFGRGFVTTLDDFGVQIDAPAHLELLDWLAGHFIETGWDLKALHKLIVTSSTYRQSSVPSEVALEIDPKNSLFGRGPRFRLPAEAVRDLPLFVSGLLVERMGGPPSFPYQPSGLWEPLSWEGLQLSYPQASGDGLYRRSVYTFWKKTLPPPFMSLFDAPDREVASAYREPGVSPQQALALLNDDQFVEAARHFATRLLTETSGDVPAAITRGFRAVTGRQPDEQELSQLLEFYDGQLQALTDTPTALIALQARGDSAPSGSEASDGAMTQVARVLFNLAETITQE